MENDTTKFTNGIGHTYCPETGKFFSKSGKEIGSYDRKYGRTNIRGKEVKKVYDEHVEKYFGEFAREGV